MLGFVIAIVAAVVAAVVIWFFVNRSGERTASTAGKPSPRTRPAPPLADFTVDGDTATVSFDVPLATGEIDAVLSDLLVSEAIEVVREKRHTESIDGVTRVVARARQGGQWATVGSVSLATPGELPPPAAPVIIPGIRDDGSFDPFEGMSHLPREAPGLAAASGGDVLEPIGTELTIPAAIESGLRAQGVDPAAAGAGDIVLGLLRLTGSVITQKDDDTHEALSAGLRTLVRTVTHRAGDHPELSDAEVRRFAADFASSGSHRALLITEKYSPFEIYDRERREPRARYITRERIQHFIDALVLG